MTTDHTQQPGAVPPAADLVLGLIEGYVENRHTLGAPEYNATTALSRKLVREVVSKVVDMAHASLMPPPSGEGWRMTAYGWAQSLDAALAEEAATAPNAGAPLADPKIIRFGAISETADGHLLVEDFHVDAQGRSMEEGILLAVRARIDKEMKEYGFATASDNSSKSWESSRKQALAEAVTECESIANAYLEALRINQLDSDGRTAFGAHQCKEAIAALAATRAQPQADAAEPVAMTFSHETMKKMFDLKESYRQDATRYRFLRNGLASLDAVMLRETSDGKQWLSGAALDASIDAAQAPGARGGS